MQEQGCDHGGKDTQSGTIFKASLVCLCSASQDGLSPSLNHTDEIRLCSLSPKNLDGICSLKRRANLRENFQDWVP